jgi:hypothetical protein
MTDITGPLRLADPLHDDPGLTDVEATAMRQAVVAAARVERAGRPIWSDALGLAVILAVMIGFGVQMGRRLPPSTVPVPTHAAGEMRPILQQPRQLQFATPGGTRIIWTFDPDFGLKEPMP